MEWKLINGEDNLFGRKIDENSYEFKQDGKDQRIICLEDYKPDLVEVVLNNFGYSLKKFQSAYKNVKKQFGHSAKWFIAECLFKKDY